MLLLRRNRFWAVLLVLLIGFCGATAFALSELRRDDYETATSNAQNLLAVLSQDIAGNLRAYDRVLVGVVKKLARPDLATLSPAMQQAYLFDGTLIEPFFTSLLVLDASGNVVRDAGALPSRSDNFSDRRYFQVHREGEIEGLFVSEPFERRLTGGDPVIALSRRLETSDRLFAGVVVGTVRLDYFRALFQRASLHPRDSINLFTQSGVVVMRTPFDEDQIGRDLSASGNIQRFIREGSGTFSAVAAIDGVRRIYTFAPVESFPLLMNVALDEAAVYADWRAQAAQIGAVLLLLCLIAFALALVVRRELARRTRAENRYRLLADNATDIIIRLDSQLQRQYVSPACRRVLGYEPDDLVGRQSKELIHPEDWPIVEAMAATARASGEPAEAVYRLRHNSGRDVWVEGRYGHIPAEDGYLVVLRDISKRKAAEAELAKVHARLEELANKDGLTGLSNRRQFDEALARECEKASEANLFLSLLLLDVDHFKRFNDHHGHQAGDECLRRVAAAIGECVRGDDLRARYGGEEFAVILPGSDEQAASRVANRIASAIQGLGIEHPRNSLRIVTISIGCTTFDPNGNASVSPTKLIQQSDLALYEAKRTGRNRAVAFSDIPTEPHVRPAPNESDRLVTVERVTKSVGAKDEAAFNTIAQSAAELMHAPIGFVSIVGRDDVALIGKHGIDTKSVSRDIAFCSHAITGTEPFVVGDLAQDPRFSANPLVVGEGGLRFYMGAPFADPNTQHSIGAVCVAGFEPGNEITQDQMRALMAMGRAVANQLRGS